LKKKLQTAEKTDCFWVINLIRYVNGIFNKLTKKPLLQGGDDIPKARA
jgi:hypothetical protein